MLDCTADKLDLTGPFEVLARLPNADVHLIWKDLRPVVSDVGPEILSSKTFADCLKLDVICIPGGPPVRRILLHLRWSASSTLMSKACSSGEARSSRELRRSCR